MSNQEVVNIVSSVSSQAAAARIVVESAVSAWKHKFPTSKVDDCAVVCLYLNEQNNNGDVTVQLSGEVSIIEQSVTTYLETINQPSKVSHVGSEGHRSSFEGIAMEERSSLLNFARAKTVVSFPIFFEEENKRNGSKRRRLFC